MCQCTMTVALVPTYLPSSTKKPCAHEQTLSPPQILITTNLQLSILHIKHFMYIESYQRVSTVTGLLVLCF